MLELVLIIIRESREEVGILLIHNQNEIKVEQEVQRKTITLFLQDQKNNTQVLVQEGIKEVLHNIIPMINPTDNNNLTDHHQKQDLTHKKDQKKNHPRKNPTNYKANPSVSYQSVTHNLAQYTKKTKTLHKLNKLLFI